MIRPLRPLNTQKTFKQTKKAANLKISKEAKAAIKEFHTDEVPDFKLNIISSKELSVGEHYFPCPPKKEVEKQKFDKVHLKIKQKRLLNDWRRNKFNLIHKIQIKEPKLDLSKKPTRKNSPKRSRSRSKSPKRMKESYLYKAQTSPQKVKRISNGINKAIFPKKMEILSSKAVEKQLLTTQMFDNDLKESSLVSKNE